MTALIENRLVALLQARASLDLVTFVPSASQATRLSPLCIVSAEATRELVVGKGIWNYSVTLTLREDKMLTPDSDYLRFAAQEILDVCITDAPGAYTHGEIAAVTIQSSHDAIEDNFLEIVMVVSVWAAQTSSITTP